MNAKHARADVITNIPITISITWNVTSIFSLNLVSIIESNQVCIPYARPSMYELQKLSERRVCWVAKETSKALLSNWLNWYKGASIKDIGNFFQIFDTPLTHVSSFLVLSVDNVLLEYPNKILNTSIGNILKYHYQYGFSNMLFLNTCVRPKIECANVRACEAKNRRNSQFALIRPNWFTEIITYIGTIILAILQPLPLRALWQ